MSVQLGQELALVQVELAHLWNDYGPEAVEARVRALDEEKKLDLIMVNIGSTAAKLP